MIEFSIPITLPSIPNLREHWAEKARRAKLHYTAAMVKCPKWPTPLLVVTITRVSPRELDGDNLQGACKGVRDGIAARLGIDDGSKLVRWEYGQEKCKSGAENVRVRIAAIAVTTHPQE